MDKIEPSHLGGGENILHESNTIKNIPTQIFSSWIGYVSWFFGLKWYVILFVIMLLLFIFFQLEYAIESRRQKNKARKEEGFQNQDNVEKIKSILRKVDEEETMNKRKNVSFAKEPFVAENSELIIKNDKLNIKEIGTQFYKWWILPSVYLLFRKFR